MGTPAPPPPPPPTAAPASTNAIEEVAEGQRLVIYAILVNILSVALAQLVDPLLGLVGLGAAVLAIIGLLRLAGGMGWSTGIKILLIIVVFLPLLSLVMLLMVNARATERLKAAGYKVGLLGAKKPA